jgi:hypothetical protein
VQDSSPIIEIEIVGASCGGVMLLRVPRASMPSNDARRGASDDLEDVNDGTTKTSLRMSRGRGNVEKR